MQTLKNGWVPPLPANAIAILKLCYDMSVLFSLFLLFSGARGAPWVRKFGNLLIQKILVLTSTYVRPSVQTLGEGDGSPKTA